MTSIPGIDDGPVMAGFERLDPQPASSDLVPTPASPLDLRAVAAMDPKAVDNGTTALKGLLVERIRSQVDAEVQQARGLAGDQFGPAHVEGLLRRLAAAEHLLDRVAAAYKGAHDEALSQVARVLDEVGEKRQTVRDGHGGELALFLQRQDRTVYDSPAILGVLKALSQYRAPAGETEPAGSYASGYQRALEDLDDLASFTWRKTSLEHLGETLVDEPGLGEDAAAALRSTLQRAQHVDRRDPKPKIERKEDAQPKPRARRRARPAADPLADL